MTTKKFVQGDCIKVLKNTPEVFDLILTDPPYNIGWKYSDKVNDKKKDYNEWCIEWAELCISRLNETGVIIIINYPENNNILYTDLIKKGYNFVQELIWNYPTNVGQSKTKYTRNFRTIIIFSKSKNYTFNPEKQEYKNPTDKRILENTDMQDFTDLVGLEEQEILNIIEKSDKEDDTDDATEKVDKLGVHVITCPECKHKFERKAKN